MSALLDFYYELAEKSLNDPVPPAPDSSPCVSGEAQRNHLESAGSPYLADWALDIRPSYKLSDAEVLDKMRWELEALKKRERLQRALDVPTVFPPGADERPT